jgi:hypothetical protein
VQPAVQISQSPVAPRLSIVVLPFANLSDDREQQYFADGITDDLTTDPSRISGSFVIARNTAFRLAASSVFDMCSKVACGGPATKSVRTFRADRRRNRRAPLGGSVRHRSR